MTSWAATQLKSSQLSPVDVSVVQIIGQRSCVSRNVNR